MAKIAASLRSLDGRGVAPAAVLPGRPAAADVAPALPVGALPALHLAGARVRGAPPDAVGGGTLRHGPRSLHRAVRHLALAQLMSAVDAVLLDALGTLVRLEPPAPRLQERLASLAGVEVDEETATRGFGAEIAYYLAHHLEGGDPDGLEDLRTRCARELARAMDLEERLDPALARRVMLESLEFSPYPDVVPVLRELRERGLRLVVVSNWDCSLPGWLERAGLAPLLDGTVSSAAVGEA